MKKAIILIAALAALVSCGKKVYVEKYITEEMMSAGDATAGVLAAFEKAMKAPGRTLVFPGGVIPVRDSSCTFFEPFGVVCNHTVEKFVFLDIDGADGLTIEGNNTELLFTGTVMPFSIRNSRNVTVKDITVDYKRTFYSQAVIVEDGKDYMDLRFPDDYVMKIEDGYLRFYDDEGRVYPYGAMLEWDTARREVAWRAQDYLGVDSKVKASFLPDGIVRIEKEGILAQGDQTLLKGTPGNTMVFNAYLRRTPTFGIDHCENILLQDVRIWSASGTGLGCGQTKNIRLERVTLEPTPGSGRMVSATADATHFENCYGSIELVDCLFRNQYDDATNFHTRFDCVESIESANQAILSSPYNWNPPRVGDEHDIADRFTLMPYAVLHVKESEDLGGERYRVTFEEDLPANVAVKDILSQTDCEPDFLIKGCKIINNRARGVLIGSRGKIVIEDNWFHTPGTAITAEGDGSYWFEDSACEDVTIRNNVFENC
ncbi:MAG: right-handed parallel beta-helix repeat-containing protein, partial [Bacteroidales bacterium]|nr:right-handed parallel beta-helix repeat-containing protein [Bacteroidales bacterium]